MRTRVAIETFLDALWAESGIAAHTRGVRIAATCRDSRAGATGRRRPGRWRDRATLFDYFAWRTRAGYSPRSNARLLSALRAFFAFQLRRGERDDDPTALLDPPKLPRSLPKALVGIARSTRCSTRRTSTRRSACAIARCSN